MEKIVLVGAGGHAKTIVDTIERQGVYEIAGFVDKDSLGKVVYHKYEVVGQDEDLGKLFQEGIHHAVISIGYMGNDLVRDRLYNLLKEIGYHLPIIVDDTAIVAKDAIIGEGTYIGRNAVINVEAEVGKMCIINTSAVVEHECKIGDFSHVAVGAVVCGKAVLGDHVFVGANATIIQQQKVGAYSVVGAGATVVEELPEGCVGVGTPAKVVKYNKELRNG